MFICSSWKMRIRVLVMSIMIVMQVWAIKSESITVPIDDVGGLPRPNISNSSSTGVSLSNGTLTLNGTSSTNIVYALFPYMPFNPSDPSMGSYNTLFEFKILSSVGALGFIAIDPDSNKTKLEDQLLSIANAPYADYRVFADNSNYLAVVYNFTRNVTDSTLRVGAPSTVFFDAFRSDELFNCTATLQYINPASIPKKCLSMNEEELLNSAGTTVCPKIRMDLQTSSISGSSGLGVTMNKMDFTVSVPSLVGFFAFGGGVFNVNSWRFTTLDLNNTIVVGTSEAVLIASLPNFMVNGSTPPIANASTPPFANASTPPFANGSTPPIANASIPTDRNASMSSTPYLGSILSFMIMAFFLIFFNEL